MSEFGSQHDLLSPQPLHDMLEGAASRFNAVPDDQGNRSWQGSRAGRTVVYNDTDPSAWTLTIEKPHPALAQAFSQEHSTAEWVRGQTIKSQPVDSLTFRINPNVPDLPGQVKVFGQRSGQEVPLGVTAYFHVMDQLGGGTRFSGTEINKKSFPGSRHLGSLVAKTV